MSMRAPPGRCRRGAAGGRHSAASTVPGGDEAASNGDPRTSTVGMRLDRHFVAAALAARSLSERSGHSGSALGEAQLLACMPRPRPWGEQRDGGLSWVAPPEACRSDPGTAEVLSARRSFWHAWLGEDLGAKHRNGGVSWGASGSGLRGGRSGLRRPFGTGWVPWSALGEAQLLESPSKGASRSEVGGGSSSLRGPFGAIWAHRERGRRGDAAGRHPAASTPGGGGDGTSSNLDFEVMLRPGGSLHGGMRLDRNFEADPAGGTRRLREADRERKVPSKDVPPSRC